MSGCNNTELKQLKEENKTLKEELPKKQNTYKTFNKTNNSPDRVNLTVSRIWWSLSREVSVSWFSVWWQSSEHPDTIPIQSKEDALKYINYGFNRWWYFLIVWCNDGYIKTSCKPFSNSDYIEEQDFWCYLWNEDPNLMRTSVIIECTKN